MLGVIFPLCLLLFFDLKFIYLGMIAFMGLMRMGFFLALFLDGLLWLDCLKLIIKFLISSVLMKYSL